MSDIKTVLETAKTQMEKTISHLEMELAKIRAGKAFHFLLFSCILHLY